jgi:hypothetical protein
MKVASEICVYTNNNFSVEVLEDEIVKEDEEQLNEEKK